MAISNVVRTIAAVTFLAGAACGSRDRNDLAFAEPTRVARVSGVQALAVDGSHLYYGMFDTGEIFKVNARRPATPTRLATVTVRGKGTNGVMGLAVFDHELFVSYVQPDRRLVVAKVVGGGIVWRGPLVNSLRRDGHIVFDPDGALYVSIGARVVRIVDGEAETVSDGWVNPFAFSIDERDRMFVADAPSPGGKAFVARGRENDQPKRRRFATGLPGSKPSGLAFVGDEVLVCRSNVGDVARLHIGLDNTARRRGSIEGVKCRNAVVVMSDGSVVTALAHEIRRYPPA